MAAGHIVQTFQAVLGKATRYRASPALGGAGVGGVVLTTGNAVWGAYADLIAAGAITVPFWVCGLSAYTPNAIQNWQLELYNATLLSTLAPFETDLTAVTMNLPPMMLPFPIECAASAQIQARAGGAGNAKTINARCIYALNLAG